MKQALLVIDAQKSTVSQFASESALALSATGFLLGRARRMGLDVFYLRKNGQGDLKPFTDGWEIDLSVAPRPGDLMIARDEGLVFDESSIHPVLQAHQIKQLLMAGIFAAGELTATVKTAVGLGYSVLLPDNCCACWDQGAQGAYQIQKEIGDLEAQGLISRSVIL